MVIFFLLFRFLYSRRTWKVKPNWIFFNLFFWNFYLEYFHFLWFFLSFDQFFKKNYLKKVRIRVSLCASCWRVVLIKNLDSFNVSIGVDLGMMLGLGSSGFWFFSFLLNFFQNLVKLFYLLGLSWLEKSKK